LATSTRTLDFIVIGSGRSGTTSLWKHLDSHPEIRTPPDKEQAFFSVDRNYERGIDTYIRKILGSAPEEAKRGTVTPAYMAGTEDQIRTVASRIKESAPDARLIALLRDPIDRAVAIYRSWARNPSGKKLDSFDEMVVPSLTGGKPRDIITGGEYGRILSIYLEFFPRDQIFVGFTSHLDERPQELLKQMFEFIGVDPEHTPPDLETRYRQGGMNFRVPGESVDALIEYMRAEVWPAVDDPGRHRERGFNWWLRYIWNIEPDDQGKEIDPQTRELLRARFVSDIEVLREQIGVDPPWAEAYLNGATGATGAADQPTAAAHPENGQPPGASAPTKAPAKPAAKRGALPTFLIIGAQKSGTRWLRKNLGRHPEIFTANREGTYFSSDPNFERGLRWYRRQFAGWDGEEIVGEATPGYMMWKRVSPTVEEMAGRIDEQLPDVKLIAIVRNPVDRAYSAFVHHLLHDRIPHDADLLEFIAKEPPKEAGIRLVMGGMYGESLRPYVERFGDRLQVLLHDDLTEDPEGLYRSALAHVGADPDFVAPNLTKVIHSYNPPPDSPYAQEDGQRRPLTAEEREELFAYFAEDVAELESLIDRDLSLWRP
jgi:hypothetical protein